MMNDACEYCIHYDDSNAFAGTGWCELYSTYVKNADCCEDYEEAEADE